MSGRLARRLTTRRLSTGNLESVQSSRASVAGICRIGRNTIGSLDPALPSTPRPESSPITARCRTVRRIRGSGFDRWLKASDAAAREQSQVEKYRETEERIKANKEEVVEPPLTSKAGKGAAKKIVRDVEEMRRIFERFDRDESGTIEPHEFPPLLSRLMRIPTSMMDMTEVWRNWDAIDADGSGEITFDELHEWYCHTFDIEAVQDFTEFFSGHDLVPEAERQIREVAKALGQDSITVEKIWREFKKLDCNGNGRLEYTEFRMLVLAQLGSFVKGKPVEVPENVMQMFWTDVDSDCCGWVSFQAFASWYTRFFNGDESPMERYYNTLGHGFRQGNGGWQGGSRRDKMCVNFRRPPRKTMVENKAADADFDSNVGMGDGGIGSGPTRAGGDNGNVGDVFHTVVPTIPESVEEDAAG